MTEQPDFLMCPFEVVIDSREQTPWAFKSLKGIRTRVVGKERIKEKLPIVVPTGVSGMKTGDYTIRGMEDCFTIERKSFPDALSTFTIGRERFTRELERMSEFDFAAVLLEFDWRKMRNGIPLERAIEWTTLDESIRAWRQRFGVHFIFCISRYWAEVNALKEMRRFWNDRQETKREAIKWMIKG